MALRGDAHASRFGHLQKIAKGAGRTDVNNDRNAQFLVNLGQASIPRSLPVFYELIPLTGAT